MTDAEPRTDGGVPAEPDVVVHRGPDLGLRGAVDSGGARPAVGCTTIIVYPHESRRPGVVRRLAERLAF